MLGKPEQGTGKMIYQLELELGCIIPVGICECLGKLVVVFGQKYDLKDQKFGDDLDRLVSEYVMQKIACLLPFQARINQPGVINEKT